MNQVGILVSMLLMVLVSAPVQGQPVGSGACRACHPVSYAEWEGSRHGGPEVGCERCHGERHTADVLGAGHCEECHQGLGWAVLWRKVGGECGLCHDAHTLALVGRVGKTGGMVKWPVLGGIVVGLTFTGIKLHRKR